MDCFFILLGFYAYSSDPFIHCLESIFKFGEFGILNFPIQIFGTQSCVIQFWFYLFNLLFSCCYEKMCI